MRISLLGPTYPFRGGIAHYTTLLCRHLRRDHQVQFISFSRQYPRLLYPGKSDREPDASAPREPTLYLLDSVNPLTWTKTSRAIREFEPELLVLPWWVTFWVPQYGFIMRAARAAQIPITVVCHNVIEHECSALKAALTRWTLAQADRLVTHSQQETQRLRELVGDDVDVVTTSLPTSAELVSRRWDRRAARRTLGLDGTVLLFFGFVRQYKGLHVLLDAVASVARHASVTLLVVGEFWKDKREYVDQIDELGIGQHVRLTDEYVPNDEVGRYFAAADLVVQPYLSGTGSAVAQLAYAYDRPVIATDVGSLSEVVDDGVSGRLVPPGDPDALARVILECLIPGTLERLTAAAAEIKNRFSWETYARLITSGTPEHPASTQPLIDRRD